jgi:hypothetical protein
MKTYKTVIRINEPKLVEKIKAKSKADLSSDNSTMVNILADYFKNRK